MRLPAPLQVVGLLPENTPLPASDKMTYLLARLELVSADKKKLQCHCVLCAATAIPSSETEEQLRQFVCALLFAQREPHQQLYTSLLHAPPHLFHCCCCRELEVLLSVTCQQRSHVWQQESSP